MVSSCALRPPPSPAALPFVTELDLDGLDRLVKSVVAEWLGQREVLDAYFDPLFTNRGSDTWASRDDWLAAAERFRKGEFQDPRSELIRLELVDAADKTDWLEWLRQVGWHGENWPAEIVAVYRYRHEIPAVAGEWFAPRPFEDCIEPKWRASEGDWIASRYLAAAIDPGAEFVWSTLSILTPRAVDRLFGKDQVQHWRKRAVAEVDAQWDWSFAGGDLLKTAVVHGWVEVGQAMARNAYLAHAMLSIDHINILCVGSVALAWSRLAPSKALARLIGALLGQDLQARTEGPARRVLGGMAKTHPEMLSHIADCWAADLRRKLAIAWTRCRPLLD